MPRTGSASTRRPTRDHGGVSYSVRRARLGQQGKQGHRGVDARWSRMRDTESVPQSQLSAAKDEDHAAGNEDSMGRRTPHHRQVSSFHDVDDPNSTSRSTRHWKDTRTAHRGKSKYNGHEGVSARSTSGTTSSSRGKQQKPDSRPSASGAHQPGCTRLERSVQPPSTGGGKEERAVPSRLRCQSERGQGYG